MRFTSTLIYLSCLSGALAAPPQPIPGTSLQARKVGNDKSTCQAYRNDMWNINESVFKVTIGRPYLGGGRCDELKSKIGKFAHVESVKCSGASGKANTKLTIISSMDSKDISAMNKGLKNAYPEITFSCPSKIENP